MRGELLDRGPNADLQCVFDRGELCICIVVWVYDIKIQAHWSLTLFQAFIPAFPRIGERLSSAPANVP